MPDYWLRKLSPLCTRPGCTSPPLADHCQCERHRDDHRERNARSMRRSRRFEAAQMTLIGVG
jgi:hypothetical protein